MGAEATMQDQAAAHTADRTALSDNSTSRELAPHAPNKEPHREVGDKKVGRSAGGFRQKRIAEAILYHHVCQCKYCLNSKNMLQNKN
mgnify:FL=1